jgi:SAM-dependent methyltransferase
MINPAPQTMTQEPLARLSDYRTSLGDSYFLVYRRLFADLERCAARAHGALLDIGCGNKPYERMFAGKITSYTGCDVVQSSERKVDIICPAISVPVADTSFDTVLCTQVIEHVADHQALLREAYRLLRSGGVLILSGPMYWHLHEEPYDFFRFTEYGLRHLLEKAGFDAIEIMANGGKWALCGQVLIHCITGTWLEQRMLIKLTNRFFSHLDDRYPDTRNTLNYVVLARKP